VVQPAAEPAQRQEIIDHKKFEPKLQILFRIERKCKDSSEERELNLVRNFYKNSTVNDNFTLKNLAGNCKTKTK
tara:strand:- start:46 stop:267 length:222 start_codon:yes stop_codon:yes gene_type:complete